MFCVWVIFINFQPLDSIIGDDSRDTTGEHMSHAFSKTCKICQAKQLADAEEKLRKQKEERDLEERRERNRELREAMRQDEMERRKREEESRHRRKAEERDEWEKQRQKRREERDQDQDDNDFGGGSFTPVYDFEGPSDSNKNEEKDVDMRERVETRSEWEFPIRIYMADEPFDSIATPIFAQSDENRPLFRQFDRYLAEKTFNLHTPRRLQEFLIESNNAMNDTRSCAFAVLKLTSAGTSNSYQKVLDYNLDQDTVYQLDFTVGDEILSVFLFPHRGSEILHGKFFDFCLKKYCIRSRHLFSIKKFFKVIIIYIYIFFLN